MKHDACVIALGAVSGFGVGDEAVRPGLAGEPARSAIALDPALQRAWASRAVNRGPSIASSSALRKPRIACSGRNARSSPSISGSPTAPNRIASARLASASVSGGSG